MFSDGRRCSTYVTLSGVFLSEPLIASTRGKLIIDCDLPSISPIQCSFLSRVISSNSLITAIKIIWVDSARVQVLSKLTAILESSNLHLVKLSIIISLFRPTNLPHLKKTLSQLTNLCASSLNLTLRLRGMCFSTEEIIQCLPLPRLLQANSLTSFQLAIEQSNKTSTPPSSFQLLHDYLAATFAQHEKSLYRFGLRLRIDHLQELYISLKNPKETTPSFLAFLSAPHTTNLTDIELDISNLILPPKLFESFFSSSASTSTSLSTSTPSHSTSSSPRSSKPYLTNLPQSFSQWITIKRQLKTLRVGNTGECKPDWRVLFSNVQIAVVKQQENDTSINLIDLLNSNESLLSLEIKNSVRITSSSSSSSITQPPPSKPQQLIEVIIHQSQLTIKEWRGVFESLSYQINIQFLTLRVLPCCEGLPKLLTSLRSLTHLNLSLSKTTRVDEARRAISTCPSSLKSIDLTLNLDAASTNLLIKEMRKTFYQLERISLLLEGLNYIQEINQEQLAQMLLANAKQLSSVSISVKRSASVASNSTWVSRILLETTAASLPYITEIYWQQQPVLLNKKDTQSPVNSSSPQFCAAQGLREKYVKVLVKAAFDKHLSCVLPLNPMYVFCDLLFAE